MTNDYPISQLSCAAYLLAAGHTLLRVEPMANGRNLCRFVFERDGRIAENRMMYWERQASVDARTFSEALADLKKQAAIKLQERITDEKHA